MKTDRFLVPIVVVMGFSLMAAAQELNEDGVDMSGMGLEEAAIPAGEGGNIPVEEGAGGGTIPPGTDTADETAEDKQLLSLKFKDMAMTEVVDLFIQMTDLNIISSPTNLTGKVSVNLKNVEALPAFEQILAQHGLRLDDPGSKGYYSIVKGGGPEPLIVETVQLKFTTPAEIKLAAASVLNSRGRIYAFKARNKVIIKTTKKNMAEVKAMIDSIDEPRRQVFIEAKFMELNETAIKSLGVSWKPLAGYAIGVSGMTASLSDGRTSTSGRTGTLTKGALRSNVDGISERYDITGEKYEETTTSFVEAPPGSGNFVLRTTVTPTRTISDDVNTSVDAAEKLNDSFARTFADMRSAVISVDDFSLMLSALKRQDGVSIVSNPRIIVGNGEKATIHIGEIRRPFTVEVVPPTQTTGPMKLYKPGAEILFGVELSVTPTVHTSSNITVMIEPVLVREVGNDVAPDGMMYPIIAEKRIKTSFNLQSGKTAAIGGLTETEDVVEEEKVPLLGDIPFFGKYLFTHKVTQKRQRETIIFVTVGMATNGEMEKLPHDSVLAPKHMIRSARARVEADTELAELKAGFQLYEEKMRKQRRLLRRRYR